MISYIESCEISGYSSPEETPTPPKKVKSARTTKAPPKKNHS